MGKEDIKSTIPAKEENKNEKIESKKPQNAKDKKPKKEELSEEDIKKKEEIELLVQTIIDSNEGVQKLALDQLITEIKSATSSMTSVPKPLKFLRTHYDTLKLRFDTTEGINKPLLSDILSILGMTMSKPDARESLKYRLTGSKDALTLWGHEYVRSLSGEIAEEWDERLTKATGEEKPYFSDLDLLIDQIVPYDMTHNAEHEACDLLLEVEKLDKLTPYVDENNFDRVCLYLTSCACYVAEPDDSNILRVTYQIYKKMKQFPSALRIALKLNDKILIEEIFSLCEDGLMKKQLAFILGRQHVYLENMDELSDLMNNTSLSEHFLALGQDLEIMEAKTPEDIYKSGNDLRGHTANVDSARQNLASTFVNAFVNAGFGQDKLMTEEGNKWLYKNKEHGMLSASASLGMILLWDVDGGLTQIDKYLYATEDYIKAGALLAVGIVNSGVRNDCDPAFALLSEYVDNASNSIRISAILGLGLAYVGTAKNYIAEILTRVIEDNTLNMEVVSIAALALGMIFVGTAHPEITQTIMLTLMERDEASLNVSHSRFLCLGLGLLYLSKQGVADVVLETLKTLEHQIGKYAILTVETCAYIGTGNVLKVQKLLDMCADHLEDKNSHQPVAVLGIAMISMGEDIGSDMAIRSFDHLLQYGEPVIRKAVTLGLGLLSISNPRVNVMDTLSKLSHDADEEVALGAILSLGLIGAGTNNSRVAGLLRNLAQYYYKDPNHLFIVRLSQGLVFLGKGTISLAPYHSDRLLLSPVAVTGLLTVLHACLDFKNLILSKSHYLLYTLVTAMHPRMLVTLDENLKSLQVPVRVGQAVDTIGQAGRPKTITGFQTQTTPVLLGFVDRAELATEDYISLTPILEGFVILKPNPNAPPKDEETKKKESLKTPLVSVDL
jgi:26S proteasome regulatory subunit N1